jgi:selenocysteine-specific translation elongation factor
MKSVIVGTAGHIDHGKLRRLRGVSEAGDARRNPERSEGTRNRGLMLT